MALLDSSSVLLLAWKPDGMTATSGEDGNRPKNLYAALAGRYRHLLRGKLKPTFTAS